MQLRPVLERNTMKISCLLVFLFSGTVFSIKRDTVDYFTGVLTISGDMQAACPMIRYLASLVGGGQVKVEARMSPQFLRVYQKESQITEWSWLGRDRNICETEFPNKACGKLADLFKLLVKGQWLDAYHLAIIIKNVEGIEELSLATINQLQLMAFMAAFDMLTPTACVPVWKHPEELDLTSKVYVLQKLLDIIQNNIELTSTEEACHYLGLATTSMNCVYALTSIAFAPVKETIKSLYEKDPNRDDFAELLTCITGRVDACSTAALPFKFSTNPTIQQMLQDFEVKCQWRQALKHLRFACPNPSASLPLLRATKVDQIDEVDAHQITKEERIFWIHIYTQQCDAAAAAFDELLDVARKTGLGLEETMALKRMQIAVEHCITEPLVTISRGWSDQQKFINNKTYFDLLHEGHYNDAIEFRNGTWGTMHSSELEYYELSRLLMQNQRLLDVSNLLSSSLLELNAKSKNYERLKSLELVKVSGVDALEEEKDLDLATVLLLLIFGGKTEEVFKLHIPQDVDWRIAELLVVARICLAKGEHICDDQMESLLRIAETAPHLTQRIKSYRKSLNGMCEMARTTRPPPSNDHTQLFPMSATWSDLFGHNHVRIFRFPGDPLID